MYEFKEFVKVELGSGNDRDDIIAAIYKAYNLLEVFSGCSGSTDFTNIININNIMSRASAIMKTIYEMIVVIPPLQALYIQLPNIFKEEANNIKIICVSEDRPTGDIEFRFYTTIKQNPLSQTEDQFAALFNFYLDDILNHSTINSKTSSDDCDKIRNTISWIINNNYIQEHLSKEFNTKINETYERLMYQSHFKMDSKFSDALALHTDIEPVDVTLLKSDDNSTDIPDIITVWYYSTSDVIPNTDALEIHLANDDDYSKLTWDIVLSELKSVCKYLNRKLYEINIEVDK
jgi:hypothetical protein